MLSGVLPDGGGVLPRAGAAVRLCVGEQPGYGAELPPFELFRGNIPTTAAKAAREETRRGPRARMSVGKGLEGRQKRARELEVCAVNAV